MEELIAAAKDLLTHRVGDLPGQGWLRDNDASRAATARLKAAVEAAEDEYDPLNALAGATYRDMLDG